MSQVLEPTLEGAAEAALPPVPAVVRAMGSLALLGLVAGLGSGDPLVALRAAPSGLVIGSGALLLSAPALLVAHQTLKLRAAPERLVGALSSAFAQVGTAALGLVPTMLFLSATSGLWRGVFPLLLTGLGILGLTSAVSGLVHAEKATTPDRTRAAQMAVLVAAWAGLAVLVALRLSVDVASFVGGS